MTAEHDRSVQRLVRNGVDGLDVSARQIESDQTLVIDDRDEGTTIGRGRARLAGVAA